MIPFPKTQPVRLTGTAMSALRAQCFERDGNRCVDCGSTWWLTMSHIISRGRRGSDTIDNVATRCWPCHVKYDLHGCPGHF
jgi:5-methylcytosine-specific restriction endonuclease McrA